MLGIQAKGAIGDAFANLGGEHIKDALNYYQQAVKASSNDFSTPIFLNKAAITALSLGENKKRQHFLFVLEMNILPLQQLLI